MTTTFAEELTSPEFVAFVNAEAVGLLPVAAIEPHGHLAHVANVIAEETYVLVLPLRTIGHSIEQGDLSRLGRR